MGDRIKESYGDRLKRRIRSADSARRMLESLKKYPGSTVVTIPFRKCQDVPRFLKKLDAFEKRSRKSTLQFD